MRALVPLLATLAGPAAGQALPPPFNYFVYHTAVSDTAMRNLVSRIAIENVRKANAA